MSGGKCLAVSPFVMPAALAAADSMLNDPRWVGDPNNQDQMVWLESFRRRAALAAKMSEISSHVTVDASAHVDWLRKKGWEAQINCDPQFLAETSIFLAAVLDVVAKWTQPGTSYVEDGVNRVKLKAGVWVSSAVEDEHPTVEVETQSEGFTFCFRQVSEAPATRRDLLLTAIDMACRSPDDQVHLDFPMVDLRVRDDAKYVLGLRSGINVVTQAAEQLRLELNEIGGRAGSAAEIVVSRGLSDTPVVKITGPFVVAVNRNGAPRDSDKVLFAAYCDQSCWAKPAAGRIA